ncbi:MAG: type II toxin-antitoxin system HipA family toxin [Steroidobacteraceae bacterium]
MARKAKDTVDAVDVYLDALELGPLRKVGRLFHRRSRSQSALSFAYSPEWLASRDAFLLDPRLELYAGEQYAADGATTFGTFLDSAPDRWGRVLLDRREALAARDERRATRLLTDWDYLLGVHDESRLGALRFRHDDTSPFLDHQALAAPPITSLPELEAVSLALQKEGAEELPAYRQWIATLLAPGTSLGGSRPKANFRDRDESLWIAKFPSADDRHDVGAWEYLLHELAVAARIEVPTCRLAQFDHRYRTFCSRRFDRAPRGRRFFVSAMTLLERRDGEAASYLEMADFIQNHGARGAVEADLEQLLRRVLFNVLVGNTDDHLRNHGFLRETTGWRLAPAFDLNPNPSKHHHALRLNEASDEPDTDTVMSTAEYYRSSARDAQRILAELLIVTRSWRKRAKAARLPASEIARIEPAFALSEKG